jgi:hypothetical protein
MTLECGTQTLAALETYALVVNWQSALQLICAQGEELKTLLK